MVLFLFYMLFLILAMAVKYAVVRYVRITLENNIRKCYAEEGDEAAIEEAENTWLRLRMPVYALMLVAQLTASSVIFSLLIENVALSFAVSILFSIGMTGFQYNIIRNDAEDFIGCLLAELLFEKQEES